MGSCHRPGRRCRTAHGPAPTTPGAGHQGGGMTAVPVRLETRPGLLLWGTGLGMLDGLLADGEISDVMVNGPGPVWVERCGALERLDVTLDRATIDVLVERIVGPLGLRVDRSSPLVDARLPDGSRVNVVVPPLAVDGPCITIRRFATRDLPLESFAPPDVAALLAASVAARRNILVSGGTGAGKTTLLNALAGHIPSGERLV